MKKTTIILLASLFIFTAVKASVHYSTIARTVTYANAFSLDLNKDGAADYQFFIDSLPMGELHCNVIGLAGNKVLDNSTYGYLDALDAGVVVAGHWNHSGVLGTFHNGGHFNGAGDKFLGVMLNISGRYCAGWIRLNLSQDRSKLLIIDAAFNDEADKPISTDQELSTGIRQHEIMSKYEIMQTGKDIFISAKRDQYMTGKVSVYGMTGLLAVSESINSAEKKLSLQSLADGMYFMCIETSGGVETKKIYLVD